MPDKPKESRNYEKTLYRIPITLKQEIRELTTRSGRSMNAEVIQALRAWVKQQQAAT